MVCHLLDTLEHTVLETNSLFYRPKLLNSGGQMRSTRDTRLRNAEDQKVLSNRNRGWSLRCPPDGWVRTKGRTINIRTVLRKLTSGSRICDMRRACLWIPEDCTWNLVGHCSIIQSLDRVEISTRFQLSQELPPRFKDAGKVSDNQ